MKDMISLIEIYTMARNTKWYEFENYIGKHFLGMSKTVVKPKIYVNISTEQNGYYQLCPKCQGQGLVSKPAWITAEQTTWEGTATSYQCDVCGGAKTLFISPATDEK